MLYWGKAMRLLFILILNMVISVHVVHAQNIEFQGSVIENYSCSESSLEKYCIELHELTQQLKDHQVTQEDRLSLDHYVVQVSNVNGQDKKMISVYYH